MLKDIIIEGVDRLGKDSLIQGILDELGFFQEIHYQKPKPLAIYQREHLDKCPDRGDNLIEWNHDLCDSTFHANKRYQIESFYTMFRLLSQPGRFILNRAHLGEVVYSPRYRKYDGSYVFDLERQFTHDHGSKFADTTLLVLLTTSDFSFIKDDGLSFDFSKKEEEQEDFKRAFERSTIKNKLMIDVSQKITRDNIVFSHYRPKDQILNEVIQAYQS